MDIIRYPDNLFRYEDVALWLEPQLGAGEYVIIAESFSGPLAVMMASAKPAGLKALVLVASFARSPRRVPAFASAVLYLLPLRSVLLIRLTRWLLVGKWGTTDFPEEFSRIIRSVPRRTLVGRLREVLRVNVVGALQPLAMTGQFIVASRDFLVPASRAEDFREAGWNVEAVEGPHFLNFTRPQEVASLIERFLAAQC
ncbi:alpha/beta fold hydrolase [Tabrizicola sp.]|uniref:alpha/beta fold hydrolase n=1 Tax=Tabrizicola sp. TaxID=2005166 RepID=UPI003F67C5EE